MATVARDVKVVVVRPSEDPVLRQQFRDFSFEQGEQSTSESDPSDPYTTFIMVMRQRRGREVVIAGCSLIDGAARSQSVPLTLEQIASAWWYFEVSQVLIGSWIRKKTLRDRILCLICQRIARYVFVECTYQDLYCDAPLPFYTQLRRLFGSALLLSGDVSEMKIDHDDPNVRIPVHVHRDTVRPLIKSFDEKRGRAPSFVPTARSA